MTINDLLDVARRRLDRLEPTEAAAAVREGAVLVDVRSERDRERDGVISGALFFPRNVLEWRLDPASGHSAPELGDALDRWIILVCNEGYQSSLAAATLRDLGFAHATDVVGGFQAWRAAGLPVEPASSEPLRRRSRRSSGMSPRTQSPEPAVRAATRAMAPP
jgi:rhodanese-related sulfurtransferase